MQTICLVALTATLALSSLSAQSRGGSDPAKIWAFLKQQHDKDGDGKIQKAEYSRGAAKFARYDKNTDGVLTDADFPVGRGRGGRNNSDRMLVMVAGQFVRVADGDKSGEVTTAEWQAFTKSVSSEDGELDVKALVAKIPQQPSGRQNRQGRQSGQGGERGQRRNRRGGFRLSPRMLDRMCDLDDSGAFDAPDMLALFVKLDKDKDGTINKAEMPRGRSSGRGGAANSPLKAGDQAPDFDLPTQADPTKTVKLSSFIGKKPVALVFGSYT